MATISVITVSRNNRSGLARTIESVNCQSVKPQHIVVDGDSTDGSKLDLQALPTSPNRTVVSEPDDGIYDAMNKGMNLADGDLIWFMNSGDVFASDDSIESVIRDFEQNAWEWAYGLSRTIDGSGAICKVYAFVPFRRTKLALGLETVPHQACIVRKEHLLAAGGFDTEFGLAADQALLYKISLSFPPRTLPNFLCDFEGGGLGSQRGPVDFIKDMRRMRKRENQQLANSALVDWCAFVVLCLFRKALQLQHDVRKRLWRRGR